MFGSIRNTGLTKSFTQLWLSHWTTYASKVCPNKPTRSFQSQTASRAATQAAICSTFIVLWAMHNCLLLHQEIVAKPKLKQQPLPMILFLFGTHPAQSELEKPWNFRSSQQVYFRPHPTIPHKYLKICFTATKWIFLGSHKKWLHNKY